MNLASLYVKTPLRRLVPSVYAYAPRILVEELCDMESVLDVACGNHSLARLLPASVYKEGVDLFPQYLKESEALGIHQKYRLLDVRHLDYPEKSFDAVIAIDILEHLTLDEGIAFLDALERIARKKVFIVTPNGFIHQEAYDANELQVHKSGWSPRSFTRRGYEVYGLYGWKALRGERGALRYRPKLLWEFISALTQKYTYRHPEVALELLAINRFKKK